MGEAGFGDVTEITLKANNIEEALAGSLTYDIVGQSLTVAPQGDSRSVTLTGPFETGRTYYFVVAPGELTGGIQLSYTDSDGQPYVKSTSSPVTFTAGAITDLGALDATFFSYPLISNTALIQAIERAVSINWTKNADGSVTVDPENRALIEGVTSLDLSANGLQDLSGIEYFTALTELYCNRNALTTLDVSGLTALTTLYCSNNSLTTLDASGLTALTELSCSGNSLTTLDVSGLTALTTLYCSNNSLTTLDVSGLTALTTLRCSGNRLAELDLTTTPSLTRIICGNQKDGEGNEQVLQVYLTIEQASKWETWIANSSPNTPVTPVIVGSGAASDDFNDEGSVQW